MSKQIKAIIMLLILLISLRTPVMAADTVTSSTNIDSTISCSEENQETQFLLPLDPESQLRHLKFELVCAAIIAICAIRHSNMMRIIETVIGRVCQYIESTQIF